MSPERLRPLKEFWDQFGRYGATYFMAEGFGRGGTYVLFLWLAALMSVGDFGLLNVFVSLLALLGVCVGLGLPEGLLRFHFHDEDFRPALAAALIFPIGATLIVLMAIIPWGGGFAATIAIPRWLLLLVIIGAPLVALRQAWLAVLRARREASAYLRIRILEPAILLAAVTGLVVAGSRVEYSGAALSYLVAVGGAAVAGVAAAASRAGFRWRTDTALRLLRFSLPLAAHSIAMTGLALFDQLVLQHLQGAVVTGVYAYAYRFGMGMYLIVYAVTIAWTPLVIERVNARRGETLPPLAGTAYRLLLAVSVAMAWLMPAIAAWVGGERYAAALPLIPLVVYAYLWVGLYGLMAGYIFFQNRSGALAAASGTAFVLNAVLNYLTIPLWGPVAAASTTIVSYVLLALLTWRAMGGHFPEVRVGRFAAEAVLIAPIILGASLFWA